MIYVIGSVIIQYYNSIIDKLHPYAPSSRRGLMESEDAIRVASTSPITL